MHVNKGPGSGSNSLPLKCYFRDLPLLIQFFLNYRDQNPYIKTSVLIFLRYYVIHATDEQYILALEKVSFKYLKSSLTSLSYSAAVSPDISGRFLSNLILLY